MAELNAPTTSAEPRWSARQTRAQFAAVAWLRWRILANSFRRKGGLRLFGRVRDRRRDAFGGGLARCNGLPASDDHR